MCWGHPSVCTVARPSHSFQDMHSSLTALYQNWICHSQQVSVLLKEISRFHRDATTRWHQSSWQRSCTAVNQVHPWQPCIERAQKKLTLKMFEHLTVSKIKVCCISCVSVTFMQLSEYKHQYNIQVVIYLTVILCMGLLIFQRDVLPLFSKLTILSSPSPSSSSSSSSPS